MPDIAALTADALGRGLTPGDRFAIAVSGGPDSLALLQLAADNWGERVTALTVDHGLRPDAAAEAAGVAAQCSGRGIAHVTLRWDGARPVANLQAAARAARYRLLDDWCTAAGVRLLLTAHHADDQAETLLMRLARGSGAGGLAGIRARRMLPGGTIVLRPLLGIRRDALSAPGWQAVTDPANANPRFDRTHARRLLAATPWLDVPRLAGVAAHLADAEAALAWTADRAWDGRAIVTGDMVVLDLAGLPELLRRRLVTRAIMRLSAGPEPRGPALGRLLAALTAGRSATLAGVKAAPDRRDGDRVRLARAPDRRRIGSDNG